MAVPFSSFHSWLWKNPLLNPDPNPNPSPNPPANSFPHPHNFPVSSADSFAALDVDAAFHLSRSPREKNSSGRKVCSSARRKVNRGVRQWRNQSLDLDFDMVIVQPDYFSGSESEGSDWSVGWFEPHAPEFCSDGEPENSFAVLVPCYGSPSPDSFRGKAQFGQEETVNPLRNTNSKSQLWAAVLSNISKDSDAGTNFYLQQWVSSLQT